VGASKRLEGGGLRDAAKGKGGTSRVVASASRCRIATFTPGLSGEREGRGGGSRVKMISSSVARVQRHCKGRDEHHFAHLPSPATHSVECEGFIDPRFWGAT